MTADTIPSLQSEIRQLEGRHHYAGPLYRRLIALRTQELKKEIRMEKKIRSLVVQMAMLLVEKGTDLGDERAVMRALQVAEFKIGDIPIFMDQAIEEARLRKAAFATLGDVA